MAAPNDDPASVPTTAKDDAADVAQTYRELVRGEQAAASLEANLTNLESKLDAILAAFETSEESEKADEASTREEGNETGKDQKKNELPTRPKDGQDDRS